ncbi:MAG: hypothetical protein J0I28_12750 [Caulobacterales bacterium]|nr:hypothetical protein [Caulobacterales bacterium]
MSKQMDPASRRPRTASAATLALALMTGASSWAIATAALAQRPATPAPRPAAPAAEVEAVVVTANPSPVPGLTPERQLSPEDVQALGVGTAADVITELANQTQSSSGEAPVILLNGKQVSGSQEINDIPAESIRRVEVLPEEASLAYGYSGNQRVINIVLQPTFSGRTFDGAFAAATEGGRWTGSAGGSSFKLEGNDRVNIGMRYTESTALTEAERDLLSQSTTPFAIDGNVVGTGAGGEIDPALSALAGRLRDRADAEPVQPRRQPGRDWRHAHTAAR